ncbi:MAG: bacillithiol biosynthesis cysteine-adding enzyme BshC [Candidatus Aminicenantes bacterium]|nr:MAG: bacillithiol biosynthesis cysteine-adding enzyme BshC [Candidatus Aminicenantes bacterium]
MNKESLRVSFSPLTDDYIYAYEKVGEFFNGNFRDLAAFQHQTEKVRSLDVDRKSLTDVLLQQNKNYGCGNETLMNIDRLTQDHACAVLTGQQVGLFSGPLYTIFKSMTTIKLAEYLSQNLSGFYVPIFWLASDDHDFVEIDHINLLNEINQIEKIHYTSPLSTLKIPASKLKLKPEISECIQQLGDLTRNSEFKSDILSHLSEDYLAGRSFAEAFARWMTRLFKSHGLIFVDASHPDIKKLGKEVFAHEIAEFSPSTQKALETSDKLKQAGYRTQIQLREGILNLFLAENERQTIQSKGDDFFVKESGLIYKKSELLILLEGKPEMFSPNVLLRPIYQDALFPTVAYVAGPGEIAYFAQMKGVYEYFDLSMPVVYPRKTVTVIEKNVNNVLENYDVNIRDIWEDTDKIISDTVKKQIPGSIDEVFRHAFSHLGKEFKTIKQEILSFDPTLEKSVDLAARRMDQQLKFLEQKILQAAKKSNKTMTQRLQKVINNLYPDNRLQERVFNIVPFLIKYDYAFLDELYVTIDMENYDHQVIKL